MNGRGADLVLSSAHARPDKGVWAQVTLDVGRNDLSRDAIARHKPLICPRHDEGEMWRKEIKGKRTLMSASEKWAKLHELKGDKEGLQASR